MKLKELFEEHSAQDLYGDDLIKKIKANCGQFLKESKGLPCYRGMNKQSNYAINTLNVTKARDSSHFLTGLLNLYLEEKYGYVGMRTRNRMYGTGKISYAKLFADHTLGGEGDVHWIFPVDNYKYVWSPSIKDVTEWLSGDYFDLAYMMEKDLKKPYEDVIDIMQDLGKNFSVKNGNLDLTQAAKIKEYKDTRKSMIKVFDQYKFINTNLIAGIESGHEIVFQTKKYYAIPLSVFYGNKSPTQNAADKIYKKICKELLL